LGGGRNKVNEARREGLQTRGLAKFIDLKKHRRGLTTPEESRRILSSPYRARLKEEGPSDQTEWVKPTSAQKRGRDIGSLS